MKTNLIMAVVMVIVGWTSTLNAYDPSKRIYTKVIVKNHAHRDISLSVDHTSSVTLHHKDERRIKVSDLIRWIKDGKSTHSVSLRGTKCVGPNDPEHLYFPIEWVIHYYISNNKVIAAKFNCPRELTNGHLRAHIAYQENVEQGLEIQITIEKL